MSEHGQEVLRLEGLSKHYNRGRPTEVQVLHDLNLSLRRRDFAALVGSSGSGKSTLLNLIGLLDTPTAGTLHVLGQATHRMDDAQRTALRGRSIGFVFQFHHLITAFTALENVLMPLMLAGGKPTPAQTEWALHLLAEVGLTRFAQHRPDQLSGGQQQRVAVARALVTQPALVLADEPTGNLDSHSAADVFALFRRFQQELGCAVLMVTHDERIAAQCERVIHLVDGRIADEGDGLQPSASRPAG